MGSSGSFSMCYLLKFRLTIKIWEVRLSRYDLTNYFKRADYPDTESCHQIQTIVITRSTGKVVRIRCGTDERKSGGYVKPGENASNYS